MTNSGFGYDGYGDEDDDGFEPPEPPRKGTGQGLRQYLKSVQAQNRELRQTVENQEAMLRALAEETPPTQGRQPNSTLTSAEQVQAQRMQEMGVIGAAPPQGTDNEQANRIAACKSVDELNDLLTSMGNTNTMYSNG